MVLGEPGARKTTALEALTYRFARKAYSGNLYWGIFIVGWLLMMIIFADPVAILFFAMAIFFIESIMGKVRTPVPLFLEARSEYAGGKVEDWYTMILQKRLGKRRLFGSYNRIVLLVDGINEIQATLYGAFIEGWRAFLRNQRSPGVIFSSRQGEDPASPLGLEDTFTICDLNDAGVADFLQVYGREKADRENNEYNHLQIQRDLAELKSKGLLDENGIGRNPYWLKMITESGLYTRNRGTLFHRFAEKLLRREIEEKPEERKRKPNWQIVPLEIEMETLAALALAMHKEKRIGFSDEEGWNKANVTLRKTLEDSRYLPDDVLNEAEAATLVRTRYKERVEFVHQLVQEFFAAYALRHETKWGEILTHSEDYWWWQTLFLLAGLVNTDDSSEKYSDSCYKHSETARTNKGCLQYSDFCALWKPLLRN